MNRVAQMSLAVIRVPVVGILLLLEPLVRFLCASLMFLGILASVAFELSGAGARFPFLGMLAASLGFGMVYVLYSALLPLLLK